MASLSVPLLVEPSPNISKRPKNVQQVPSRLLNCPIFDDTILGFFDHRMFAIAANVCHSLQHRMQPFNITNVQLTFLLRHIGALQRFPEFLPSDGDLLERIYCGQLLIGILPIPRMYDGNSTISTSCFSSRVSLPHGTVTIDFDTCNEHINQVAKQSFDQLEVIEQQRLVFMLRTTYATFPTPTGTMSQIQNLMDGYDNPDDRVYADKECFHLADDVKLTQEHRGLTILTFARMTLVLGPYRMICQSAHYPLFYANFDKYGRHCALLRRLLLCPKTMNHMCFQ